MKTLIILFTILFSTLLNAQWPLVFYGVDVTPPSYFSEGAIARGTPAPLNVPLPSTVNENDILIIQFLAYRATSGIPPTLVLPAGFAVGDTISGIVGANIYFYGWIWKRAVGDEDGDNVAVTITNADETKMVATSYAGCIATGTPFEAETNGDVVNSATVTTQEITTLGAGRLAVNLVHCINDNTLGPMTDWTKNLEVTEAVGTPDVQFVSLSQDQTSAGTVSQGTATNSGSDRYVSFTFAFIPE